MVKVEGYKAFRGKMRICPRNEFVPPFELEGDFLYKPDAGCWYHGGRSFVERICTVVSDETGEKDDDQ